MSSRLRSLFEEAYGQVKEEVIADSHSFTHTLESRAWLSEVLDYNLRGGKLNRGLAVVDSLVLLKPDHSEAELHHAILLGWCIEILQVYFLILDDIMDGSEERRGQKCWYKKVNMIAVNDAVVLRNCIHCLLRHHFHDKPYYMDLRELFDEVEYQTACGQMLDLITTPDGQVDLPKYVMDTYLKIVKYKTAYYSFYLPVACALYMAGKQDKLKTAEQILLQMGTYFQIQDDYLDCYGSRDVIGKNGTDIEDSKCSWLVVQAIARASDEQKDRLHNNYGQNDEECVAEVKKVYSELNLEKLFKDYEEESYREITGEIDKVDNVELQGVLKSFLSKIYKRRK